MSSERLARSARPIAAATLSSRLLGLVRNYAVAHFLGAGDDADAFNVATRIPNMLRDLFAEGAMSASFVPTFTRRVEQEGREAAWRLGSQVINALIVITGSIVLLGIVFAWPLTTFVSGKFAAVPGKLELTVSLVRLNMPFLTLVAVAAACMGMLNALRRFFIPAFSPAMYNVMIVFSCLALIPLCRSLGWPDAMAITWGSLLGGLGQIVVQWPFLRREGFRHRWILNFRDPALREVLFLMGPGTIGVAASQINLLVNTYLATSSTGQVTWLNSAFQLMYLPIGLFGVSVATAALPDLALHASRDSLDGMRSTISSGLRLMFMLSVPSMVGLIALGVPILELLQETGRYSHADVLQTASALTYYAPGLLGYSIVKLASPSFYALREPRTPVLSSVFSVFVNVVLNVTLMHYIGYIGLALGTAIAANVNAMTLLVVLSRRIGGIDGARVLRSFLKISVASLAMGVAAHYAEVGLRTWITGNALAAVLPHQIVQLTVRTLRVGTSIGAGIVVLLAMARLLQIDEFTTAMSRVLQRLRPPANPPSR